MKKKRTKIKQKRGQIRLLEAYYSDDRFIGPRGDNGSLMRSSPLLLYSYSNFCRASAEAIIICDEAFGRTRVSASA